MKKNIQKKSFVVLCLMLGINFNLFSQGAGNSKQFDDRAFWVERLYEMAAPVLYNMSKGELRKNMPLEFSLVWDNRDSNVGYMEAFGRLMAGIAPWLALPDDDTPEGEKRKRVRGWALQSFTNAVDPDSPDYLLWGGVRQVLVDASFIANAFIRAPQALWEPLDEVTQQRYIERFRSLRSIRPAYNNWLLFRCMIEAFFISIGEEFDAYAVDTSIRRMNAWYIGDGWYTDGPDFALDYYSSFVIHPMLVEIIEVLGNNNVFTPLSFDIALQRMQRHNQQLERLIAPDATFPPIGRSMTYRMGVFHSLSLAAWRFGLPDGMTNGQVRYALTSVMQRMFATGENFCEQGFLRLGFLGHQPELAESYINNGSTYLTSFVFLPLGLPADHDFWTAPAEDWTSRRIWSGQRVERDRKRVFR